MPNRGHMLQWSAVALLGVGVVMVNSASLMVGGEPVTVRSLLLGRPAIYAMLAVAVMIVAGRLDIRRLNGRGWLTNPIVWLTAAAMTLCVLVLVPGVGHQINGARRWLVVGPSSWHLTFQPSELAKWVLLMAVAWWCARYAGSLRRFMGGLLPPIVLIGLICGLIIVEDLGTAVLMATVAMLMLLAAGARFWHVAALAPPALAAIGTVIIISPYRIRRLTTFLDPFADPQGSGYHLIQSYLAIASGRTPWGLGNGPHKLGYLPADTTDFIFAIICEELGLAGAAMVIALYVLAIWLMLGIVRDCRHMFGRMLGLGVMLMIGLQALMNLAVVTGVVPTKGIALPLVSFGGTGWVLTGLAIGLVVAVDRLNRLEQTASEAPVLDEPRLAAPRSIVAHA